MPTKRNKPDVARVPDGLVRTRDLEAQGASGPAIRRMVAAGQLEQVGRGLYASAGFEPTENHGLAEAAALVPHGIVCLLSALQFHHLGTQAPLEVWLAIGTKARKPAVADPPLRIVRFSDRALREYRRSRRPMDELFRAAAAVRVANVMRPYLESVSA